MRAVTLARSGARQSQSNTYPFPSENPSPPEVPLTTTSALEAAAQPLLPPPPVTISTDAHGHEVISTGPSLPYGATRRLINWETRCVMAAFLVPGVIAAVLIFAQHLSGVGDVGRFAVVVQHHPLTNMFLAILAYLPVAAIVPLALFSLNRAGQRESPCPARSPSVRITSSG